VMKGLKLTLRKENLWQASTVFLSALLIGLILLNVFKPGQPVLTGQAVGNKVVNYISESLLQGQASVELKSVEETNDLYNVKISIDGREFDLFVTKDAKLLFPQAIDLDQTPQVPSQSSQEIPKTETPDVKLYTMSFCRFGDQAEEAMRPVAELLMNDVEVEPHYVIYNERKYGYKGPQYCLDEENEYCSMHGIQELNQDVRELCVYKYEKDKYWGFVSAINRACSYSDVDACWEGVAAEQGIDVDKIKKCQEEEAIDLLRKEVELNEEYGVEASPTLIINGVEYSGARTPEAYKQAICSAFTTAPSACTQTLNSQASSPTGGCG